MKRLFFAAAAALALSLASFADPAPIPFPQAGSDLKPDPALHFGVLPNGLRYVIMPNREPRERVSMRLLVLCGSLDEHDDERGLAHYLEHMAFNGSTHFAPDTLVKYFQQMGMRFGADANANTYNLRTIYMLDLPDHAPETLRGGLQVFRDFAGGLLLKPEMVDKERPIILAEKRTGDVAGFREAKAQTQFLLAGTRLASHITIGETDDIEHATREKFLQIYNEWYRPERMALVIVGDLDPALVEPQVVAKFKDLTDRAPAPAAPEMGHVRAALGLQTFYHHEAESPMTNVGILVLAPYTPSVDSTTVRRHHLIRNLATAIVNRRLQELAKTEGAPFRVAGMRVAEVENFYRQAQIGASCAPEHWQGALGVMEQELRRALQYGFTASELKEVVADDRAAYQQSVADAPTRRSERLVDELTYSLLYPEVFMSPADALAFAGPVLDQVTPEQCLAELRFAFSTPGRYVVVTGNADLPADANAAIAAAYHASEAVAVTAPKEAAVPAFAYTDFGPVGEVTRRQHLDDLDATLVTFANGVRLNVKHTDFETGRVRVHVRLGAGQLTQPKDQRGLNYFAAESFQLGGLGKHSADDIRKIYAGKVVNLNFSVQEDAFACLGVTTPQDLEAALQLLTAYVVDPGYRPEAERAARKYLEALYTQLQHTPNGVENIEIPQVVAPDYREGLPPKEVMMQRSLAEEKAWMAPALASGPIEIALVGDLDVDQAIALVAKTLGALPKREAKPSYREERSVRFADPPVERDYTYDARTPRAVVQLVWSGNDAWDFGRNRRLNLLADVLRDRMRIKIRERMGAAYGVAVNNVSSVTYPGYGRILVNALVAPDRADETLKAMLEVASDLSGHGVTEEEFLRAKKPAVNAVRDEQRNNQFWAGRVLPSCQEYPQLLERARTNAADTAAITAADLSALAKTYLAPEKAFRFKIIPAAAPAAPSSAPAAAAE